MSPKKKFAAFVGAVTAIALFVAPIAAAHHPQIIASMDCNGTVSWTAQSWSSGLEGTFPDPTITKNAPQVQVTGGPATYTGAFNAADNYRFSGTFTVAANVNSVTLTATTNGQWGDGYSGYDSTTATATRPTDCKSTPSITTQASGPVTVGQPIHDLATLSGAKGATGAVTFQVFGPGDTSCATPLATIATSSKSVDSDGNGTYTSGDFTTTSAGTYFWRAFFAGDSKNVAVSGPCGAPGESSVVNKKTPSISTTLSASTITVGGSIHDTSSLSGATANAGGTVTYTVFTDSSCSKGAQDAGTKTVTNGVVPNSNTMAFTAAGTYYWQASYSGDSNNAAALSPCTSEILTVTGSSTPPPPPPPPPPPATPGTPAISITKNPKSQSIPQGGTANFTIVVTNTGNTTLTNVTVTDPLSPDCAKTSAAIPALASMAAGASVTYTCSLAGVQSAFTNVATVVGTTPTGGTVTATDNAPVTVTAPQTPPTVSHPSIKIVKDPKQQTIASGGTATFKITVTNTGDVALSSVTVSDPKASDCSRTLGTLSAGQSRSYSCTKDNVKAAFLNVATATGKPPTGSPVSANDHANVKVAPFVPPSHPRIAITKSPKSQTLTTQVVSDRSANGKTKTKVTYGTAHFTIKVTNTGNVTLSKVHVTDPASPGCNRQLGTLAAGASKTYSCARAAVSKSFRNVATAIGTSKGKTVKDTDHANVVVKVKTSVTGGAKTSVKKPHPGSPDVTGTASPSFTG